jgi:hypothetical protein
MSLPPTRRSPGHNNSANEEGTPHTLGLVSPHSGRWGRYAPPSGYPPVSHILISCHHLTTSPPLVSKARPWKFAHSRIIDVLRVVHAALALTKLRELQDVRICVHPCALSVLGGPDSDSGPPPKPNTWYLLLDQSLSGGYVVVRHLRTRFGQNAPLRHTTDYHYV